MTGSNDVHSTFLTVYIGQQEFEVPELYTAFQRKLFENIRRINMKGADLAFVLEALIEGVQIEHIIDELMEHWQDFNVKMKIGKTYLMGGSPNENS